MHANADNLIASRFDTVIYDLDGTLIDSAKDMQVAVSRVLADHGLPDVTEDDVRNYMGQGSKVTMGKAFAKYGISFDPTQAGLSALEMFQYFGEVIEARRARPGEDLISHVNRINDEWMQAARRLSPRVIRDLLEIVGPPLFAHFATFYMNMG